MGIHTRARYTDAEALAAAIAGGLSEFVWKDASEEALSDLNRTATLDWTDLDLTAYTSANAKRVTCVLDIYVDSINGGEAYLYVRKNGTTPLHLSQALVQAKRGDTAGAKSRLTVPCGLDNGQVLEYRIYIIGTIQIDSHIFILEYAE